MFPSLSLLWSYISELYRRPTVRYSATVPISEVEADGTSLHRLGIEQCGNLMGVSMKRSVPGVSPQSGTIRF